MIELINICKKFNQSGNVINVLDNLNLKINKKDCIGILGHSGSGKSTLLSLLSGLDRPDSGKIIFDESDITKLNEEELIQFRATNISIVFQQFHLISHLTSLENVMLPLEILGLSEKESFERSHDLLKEVGLESRLNHFPTQMSGGECQRVALARALVSRPKLLLADEPSGNLDQETGTKVMNLFFEITKKYSITTCLVTHNENLIQNCDFAYRLSKGKFEKVK